MIDTTTIKNPYQSMLSAMDALDAEIEKAVEQLADCPGAGCNVCMTALKSIQSITEAMREDREMVTRRTLINPESSEILSIAAGISAKCASMTVQIIMSMVSAAHEALDDMAAGKIEIVMDGFVRQHAGDLRKAAETIIERCDAEMARAKNGAN